MTGVTRTVFGYCVVLLHLVKQINSHVEDGFFQKFEESHTVFRVFVLQTDARSLLSCAHACMRYSGSTCSDVCSHFHYENITQTCFGLKQGNNWTEAWTKENKTVYVLKKKQNEVCDIGWRLFGNVCYYIEMAKLEWSLARENCENMGGCLATAHNETVDSFLGTLITTCSPDDRDAWLGASYSSALCKWKWESGEPFSYRNWGRGQPDLLVGTCLVKVPKWYDRDCTHLQNSVCEK
ncbi:type-2 ice-structuring protein-like [Mya arenaria]|uniref:type-2 ice-structuring protein-like n=1 Tax=Mya arenaria TaxID=6604 RepID=UPI0022E5EB87|nr:type-2 ice-structuring protein-like [Mya arenaria]